ncbi:MAG TPA: hypothetical protein VFI47_02405 [Acidimicrobiales bacterium]|nr:hypothetical protein [Acidimicrobiales bacterium]
MGFTSRGPGRLLATAVASVLLVTGLGVVVAPPGGAVTPPIVNAPATLPRLIPVHGLRKATTPPIAGGATTTHIYTTDPAERAALRSGGWQLDAAGTTNCDGIVGYLFDRPVQWTYAGVSQSTVPVHRFYHQAFNGYFLKATDDQQFIDNLALFGFADEGIVGHGFRDNATAPTAAAAPLRMYMDETTKEAYHSANAAPPLPGFTDRGTIAFVRPAGPPSTDPSVPEQPPAAAQLCPVTMLTRTIDGVARHLATTSIGERAAGLAAGWTLETTDVPASADGVVGYLWDRRVPGTDPVYRFRHDALRSYYYESIPGDPAGRIGALAFYGFASEGVIGYDFATPQPGTVPWTSSYRPDMSAYYYTTAAGAAFAAAQGYAPGAPIAHLFTSADAPAPYYEIHRPAGTSKGIVVDIHGGGWQGELPWIIHGPFVAPVYLADWPATGARQPDAMAQRLVARGWTVYSVEYHSGGPLAAGDVDWFVTRLRDQVGAGTKICTAGTSAGAHLALLTAARRRDVACTIADAGPTHLPAAVQGSPTEIRPFVEAAFGPDQGVWATNSPALTGLSGVTTKVLMATAANDTLVVPSQMTLMGDALVAAGAPTPLVITLAAGQGGGWGCPAGSIIFVHACVTQAAYDAYLQAEAAFIDGI